VVKHPPQLPLQIVSVYNFLFQALVYETADPLLTEPRLCPIYFWFQESRQTLQLKLSLSQTLFIHTWFMSDE